MVILYSRIFVNRQVIPPKDWVPRKKGYDVDNIPITIPTPICQVVTGKEGVFHQANVPRSHLTIKQFAKLANTARYRTPKHSDYGHLERFYWDNITDIPPIYVADVSGSITDPDCSEWNLNSLKTILDNLDEEIDGVNTPYLYFGECLESYCLHAVRRISNRIASSLYVGMWKTTFPWHTEDMDLYSRYSVE